jgi:tetratricopeptide (TPR) repeat protein
MNMKQSIVILAALSFSMNVKAQSLEEGIRMYNYERYESAQRILTGLTANPIANYYYGLAELEQGNVSAAKIIFQKFPESYANISGQARAAFEEGKPDDGMMLAKALAGKAKKREWEPLRYAADAITYSTGGEYQQAVDWYKAAIAVKDTSILYMALGDAYLKLPGSSSNGLAVTNYEKAIEKNPKSSLAYSRLGKLWYQARISKEALANWEKAKEADPSNPLPYRDLADAYAYTGNYELARKNIEKYLELSDKTAEDLIKYANILYLAKDYEKANKVANDLIQKGVTKPGVYGIMGQGQYELKDAANKYGLDNYKNYMTRQDPKKVTPADYRMFGKIMLKNGMADSANYYFQKAIDADKSGNKASAYRDNADALREAKEWVLAAAWYEKLITEFPDQAKATDYFYRGFTYYYGRDYVKAGTAFEQMETKFPDQPSATYWRGRSGAAIDTNATDGPAVPHYKKWLDMNVSGYEKKPADLKQALQYLIIYYYNKNDKENTKMYMDLLEKVDPNDGVLKQIKDAQKSSKSGGGATPNKAKKN